ncbi:PEGA domain protein [Salinisphaera hydrothermalis EPR70]
MSFESHVVAQLAVLAALAVLSGCATITHGTHQNVSVTSTPAKATIYVNGKRKGTTPTKIAISRHGHQTLQLTHAGYAPYVVHFTHHTSRVTAGNVLVGGLIGVAVDAKDGASGYNTPKKINAQMVPLASAQNPAPATNTATSAAQSHS